MTTFQEAVRALIAEIQSREKDAFPEVEPTTELAVARVRHAFLRLNAACRALACLTGPSEK